MLRLVNLTVDSVWMDVIPFYGHSLLSASPIVHLNRKLIERRSCSYEMHHETRLHNTNLYSISRSAKWIDYRTIVVAVEPNSDWSSFVDYRLVDIYRTLTESHRLVESHKSMADSCLRSIVDVSCVHSNLDDSSFDSPWMSVAFDIAAERPALN